MIRGAETLVGLFAARVAERGTKVALKTKRGGAWEPTTWNEWDRRARVVASELLASGVEKGDRVAVSASTREEWVVADVAVLLAGAVTVPIYHTLVGDQAAYILENSGAKVLVAESASLVKRIADGGGLATLEGLSRIVLVDATGADEMPASLSHVTWEAVMTGARGSLASVDARSADVKPDDLAVIMYTSGTTGPPKGAMLTHGNFAFETEVLEAIGVLNGDDEQLLFLPMAHIFAKVIIATQIRLGFVTAFAESVAKVMDDAVEVNPTFMACVPRMYEKIYAGAHEKIEKEGAIKRKIFDWAVETGRRHSRARLAKGASEPPDGMLGMQHRYAQKLVLSKIRARFGSRLRVAISGGAPLAKELAEWFDGAGIPILEAYGLTEVTGGSNLNRFGAQRFGTVGPALPGVEVKIAADGEVLIRGGNVMRGYWKHEDATREIIDADGWFHSGDIGVIDADGFLTITDRKKDIIVTAGGKNVAPQNIENLLKQSSWISQAMVHGDKRAYLVALVTLNVEPLARFAAETGRPNEPETLATLDDVKKRVQTEIDAVNQGLSSYESIKKFAIVAKDFTIDGGELTPTLKVKRKVVTERNRALLDSLYR
jgi:long-chain acyl-CoA synthetase